MVIIGVDYHPGFQQISLMIEELSLFHLWEPFFPSVTVGLFETLDFGGK